jgi:hypothetical protein
MTTQPTSAQDDSVSVDGRVHKVPGSKLQKWIMKRRQEWKGRAGCSSASARCSVP